jgi:O-antigen ligase
MQPEHSSRVRRSPFSIYDLLPTLTFLILGFAIGLGLATAASLFHRHSPRYDEILLVAALFVVPTFVFWQWAVMRQALQGLKLLISNLCWYHWVWLLLFLSMQTWRKRVISEIKSEPLDTFAAARAIMVTLAGSYLLYRMFMRKTDFLSSWLRGIPGLLMVFVLVVLFSTFWSIYWQWTLYKGCEYAVDVALLAALLVAIKDVGEFKGLFDWTMLWLGILLFNCWIWAAIDPADALSHNLEEGGVAGGPIALQLAGVFPSVSCNRVGEYSAIVAALALARLLPVNGVKRVISTWYVWVFMGALITLVFAQTRSATGPFLIAVVLIFWFSGRFKHGVAIALLGATLMLASGAGGVFIDYMRRGQTDAQMESLTGRIQWWEMAWKKYTDAPLTGFGAFAAGRFLVMGSFGNNIATMHSDWVETLVGCGLLGIFPLVAVMGVAWWYLLRFMSDANRTPEERQLCLEAIVVFTVVSFRTVFSTDLTWHSPLTFWLPLGYAEYLRRRYGSLGSERLI